MFRTLNQPALWVITLSAAGILMVTMGARQSLGLFVSPLNTSTGLGIASISLAMAVGQFMWGAIQPVAGAVADRYGPEKVLIGEVVGVHLRDDCLIDGRLDPARYNPAARLGYHDYTFVREVRALRRPKDPA